MNPFIGTISTIGSMHGEQISLESPPGLLDLLAK